ncbi:hypothetical protein F5146DRAFT_1012601 [Armillaria mellea]|nr:hypothetical protein F5146DRAFT_1012601 [Armillaria mellea]
MATSSLVTRSRTSPPWHSYITFSIDVAATLEMYCDGGDEAILQKLTELQDRKYAGRCIHVVVPRGEERIYCVVTVRPLQQGLTKPHPRKPQHARPTMCVPVLPTTAHPRSREPLGVRGSLPWDNCYHPTCYDVVGRVSTDWRDYSQSPLARHSRPLHTYLTEDKLYRELLQAGLDDDRILRILDGQEEAPDADVPDNASQTSAYSEASQMFLAKVPGAGELEEDLIFVAVMRIDHVLSNVPEICDPSQLCGDLDLFQGIVQEYQLARYGSAVFPHPPEIDDTPFIGNFSEDSLVSAASGTSSEDLGSDSPISHALDLSLANESEVSSNITAPIMVSPRKGKWRIESLFRQAITNLIQFFQGHKRSAKL